MDRDLFEFLRKQRQLNHSMQKLWHNFFNKKIESYQNVQQQAKQ